MRRRTIDFVRKTVSLDSDIRPLLEKNCDREAKLSEKVVFLSRVVNDMIRGSNFKNLDKFRTPRNSRGNLRMTLVIDMDNHDRIISYTANAIENCAKNYCDAPSNSYSKILNSILRKALHI